MNQQSLLDKFLQSSERMDVLYRAIESARNGIVVTDPRLSDNPIIYANSAFLQLTGYGLEEILGRNCRFLQADDRNQKELSIVRDAIASGKACVAVLRNYKKDGTLFVNELSISPVFDNNQVLINFIGVQNDITARTDAEKRVAEFYSMVSHELRTPLSSIQASLGLVSDGSAGEIPASAKRLIQIASKNSERLLKLVDDILDLKKIEAGKMALHLTMVEPATLVGDVHESLQGLASDAKVTLTKVGHTSKPLCADQDRIQRVLINLIGNAIKFSPAGATVTTHLSDTTHGVKFVVEDQGPGIPPEEQGRLFQKFQQLDSSDTRSHTGSGLGLAIAKTIVELHGGSIGVESKPGKGCSFWFTLPLVP